MKKVLSVMLTVLMLLSVTANAFAAARVIPYDAYCIMRDILPGTTYAEKLFDADFAEMVEKTKGTIPEGLEIQKTALPNSEDIVWALVGNTTASAGFYKFYLKCTEKDGTEKTAYGEIHVVESRIRLNMAISGVYYSDILFRFPEGSDIKWEIGSGIGNNASGMELKEMNGNDGHGLYLCGTTTKLGLHPLSVEYTTYGGQYLFGIIYDLPVDEWALPASDECYIEQDFNDVTEMPAGWQTQDLDGDGKAFEVVRHDGVGNLVGYIDVLESASGENGCDNVLYSPYFYTSSSYLEIYHKASPGDVEIYYTTEDTLDLANYTKFSEYTVENSTGHRKMDLLQFEDDSERFVRIAIRHKTERANYVLTMGDFAVKGSFNGKLINIELGKPVSEQLAEYPKDYSYKITGTLPEWFSLNEFENGDKKVLTLNGSTERFHSDTVMLKVFDKDNTLKFAVELIIKSGDFLLGDANLDGKVNTGDATVVLKYSAGMINLDENALYAADITCDGVTNTADATLILRCLAGMG